MTAPHNDTTPADAPSHPLYIRQNHSGGWIGVDLDGTLAYYDGWKGPAHIGEPVPLMLAKVKVMLAEGKEVRIFTARVYSDSTPSRDAEVAVARMCIENWCYEHLGVRLQVTNVKDFGMTHLYDDRAIAVEFNTGVCRSFS